MAIAVAQQVTNPAAGGSLSVASGTTQTASITLSAGSTVIAFARGQGGARTVTCADNVNGSYTSLDTGDDGNANWTTFYKQNVAAGAVTVTFTWPNSNANRGVIVLEITGAVTSGGVQAHTVATGGNSSGAMTVGTVPALVVGIAASDGGNTLAADTGSGFTAGTPCWYLSFDSHLPESRRVTSTGSYAATFTGGNSGDKFFGIVVTEASTGNTMTVAATSPVATLAAALASTDSVAVAATSPVATLAASVASKDSMSVAATSPVATLAAALAVVNNVIAVAATSPAATLAASIASTDTLAVAATSPVATAAAALASTDSLVVAATSPVATLAANLTVSGLNRTMDVAATSPVATLAAALGSTDRLTVAATSPVATLAASMFSGVVGALGAPPYYAVVDDLTMGVAMTDSSLTVAVNDATFTVVADT